jgi:tetrahydromethanopterin S-methyltransferase subunit E
MLKLAPELLKFLALHCAIGVAAGMVFLAGLIIVDLAGLRTLIWTSANPILPLALLAAGLSITFGGVAMAGAVMMLPSREDD